MANVDRSTLGGMESLLREHGPFLRRLAQGLVRDEHAAEDLVHDTWLAALRRPEGSLRDARGWLGAVLQRRAASHRRREQLRPRSDAAHATEDVPGDEHRGTHAAAEAIALRLERERLLHDAVTRLPEPYRTTIVLRYHEELTPTAIALRTGAPVKTVKTRLARGLEQLRAELARRGEDGGAPGRDWFAVIAPLLPVERLAAPTTVPELMTWISFTLMKKSLLGLVFALVSGLIVWRVVDRDSAVSPSIEPESPPTTTALAEVPEDSPALVASTPPLRAREAAGDAPVSDATTPGGLARIEVHATDTNGQPVVGRRFLVDGPLRSGARDEVRIAATAEDGAVAFPDLAPGTYSVRDALGTDFDRDARGVWTFRPVVLAAEATEVVAWTVRDELVVRARVEHRDGRPAALAELWCVDQGGGDAPHVWRLGATDAAGALEFRAGRALRLQASLASHLPSEMLELARAPEVEPGVREARLVLGAPGAALIGVVVDGAGLPVAGARVVAGPGGGWISGDMRGYAPEPPAVETQVDGTFRYAAALPPGQHEVAAFAPGFAATTMHVEVPQRVPAAPLEVRLVLARGGRIVGRVTRPDGLPAHGAEVGLGPLGALSFLDELAPRVTAVTARDGSYELRLVPLGEHVLRAESDHAEPLARAEARIAVGDGPLVLDLVLDERPVIAGRVIDRDGAPVEGVRIGLEGADLTTYPRSIKTDAAGRFRATCLPKPQLGFEGARVRTVDGRQLVGGTWTVEAFSITTSARAVHGSIDGVAPGTLDLELVIDRPERASGFLVGRLVATAGSVPEDVVVTLWRDGVNAGHFIGLDRGTGTFRQGPLFPGEYRLEVTRDREVIATRSGIDVAADETVDIGVLHLDGGGSLEATLALVGAEVLPAGGEAALLGQASVTLSRDGQRQQWLERTDTGWRSRGALEPGPWRLTGSGEALVFTPRDVDVLEAQVTRVAWSATLARAADIRVRLPAARTWSRVRVRATDASGALVLETPFFERKDLTPDDFASFEENLPAGTLTLTVETDTAVGHSEAVTVPPFPTPFRKVELRVP